MSEKLAVNRTLPAWVRRLLEAPQQTALRQALESLDSLSGFGDAAFQLSHSLACRYVYEMMDNASAARDAALANGDPTP